MRKEIKNEILLVIVLLILNLNSKLSLISILILYFYGRNNRKDSIKAIMYSFLLSQLNSSIFNSNISTLRTILNIYLMIKLLNNKKNIKYIKYSRVILILTIYCIYIVFIALLVSWLPLVSIFKGVYFTVGLSSILLGVATTSRYDWTKWTQRYFIMIISINTVFLLIPNSYLSNNSFKGIFTNPNALGIFTVLGAAILLYSYTIQRYRYNIIFLLLAVIQVFLSNSRTSIITLIVLIIYFAIVIFVKILKSKGRKSMKYGIILCIVASLSVLILNMYSYDISKFIENKLRKGNTENILYSRQGQLETFEKDFNSNQFIGVGFGVDNGNGNSRSLELMLSYPVERGNIILAVLSETGVVGLFIFISFIISLLYECKYRNSISKFINKILLIISVFSISFGEMTFFSGNSIGVLQWLILAIYIYQE